MKKIAQVFIALFLICSMTISCSSDSSGDDEAEKAAAEQMSKFEEGYWWVNETERYIDYNNNNEESFDYTSFFVKYGADGKWTGKYFGKIECSEDFTPTGSNVSQEDTDAGYEESWFPIMNYNKVCQYLKKEFGSPDKDDGYMYSTYQLKKASETDEYFPDWAKEK